ncbi:hypothetical protein D3C81_769430 [compost metagenome]
MSLDNLGKHSRSATNVIDRSLPARIICIAQAFTTPPLPPTAPRPGQRTQVDRPPPTAVCSPLGLLRSSVSNSVW